MRLDKLVRDAILRIGVVIGVEGRRIFIQVDKNKNHSDLFYDGDILRNVSVGGFVEIRKGYTGIIGKVEGERVEEDTQDSNDAREILDKNIRVLTVSVSGHIDETGAFNGGTKELPLIGNEAFLLTRRKLDIIHDLLGGIVPAITIGSVFGEDMEAFFPIDGLFNGHIAIFGNTGSGKTNTLAVLYQELLSSLDSRNPEAFRENARFVIFDFNGEYSSEGCITNEKTPYRLSTGDDEGDKLPLPSESLMDLEVLSILSDATEKTQKPFIKRTLKLFKQVQKADDPDSYIKGILRNKVQDVLLTADKQKVFTLIEYFRDLLDAENTEELVGDIEWNSKYSAFFFRQDDVFLNDHPERIPETRLYASVENYAQPEGFMDNLLRFFQLQLIIDATANRAQSEHIAPVISRLLAKRPDVDKLFNLAGEVEFWQTNCVVIDLHDVNLEMKKTIPLLMGNKLYKDQKKRKPDTSLTIIIDEAHNILSAESFREAESWKDYRLETFEEIIKEGRKFGVFVTIASQRPSDISPTITSQAHNYFIHRLVNQLDLKTIASAVSYIDKLTEESIPTLPTGTCIVSGVVTTMPLKVNVRHLGVATQPRSATRKYDDIVPEVYEEPEEEPPF